MIGFIFVDIDSMVLTAVRVEKVETQYPNAMNGEPTTVSQCTTAMEQNDGS